VLTNLLDLELTANDAGANTLREFLGKLLVRVITDGDLLKRPFGNSDWIFDIYKSMIVAGVLDGKIDEDGYVEEVDDKTADEMIVAAIQREMK
jgi:hypothetical protein